MTDVPLKHLCSLPPEYGLNITPDRYRDEGVRLLRTSDIATGGGVRDSGGVFLDAVDVPAEMLLRDGDLLFSRSGTLGRALLYSRDQHGEATFAGFLVRFRLRRGIDPRAIRYWSESSSFVGTVASQAIQSTISNFNADRYANLAVPGWLVQHSVAGADYLDAETARIDALHQRRISMMALLGEWEQANLLRLLGDWRTARKATLRQLGAEESSLDHEDLLTQEEVDLVGGFLQSLFDTAEMWDEFEPAWRTQITFDLGQQLKALRDHGWRIFAARSTGSLVGGVLDSPTTWVTAYVHVVRKDSSAIVSIPTPGQNAG